MIAKLVLAKLYTWFLVDSVIDPDPETDRN